jgi:hypothetical protein
VNAAGRGPVLLFASTLLLSALLLFWIELFFARMLLPPFGGTPAVWTTCLLFFQAALLAGYGYAHASQRRLSPKQQVVAHAVLLLVGAAFLPAGVAADLQPPPEAPVPTLLLALTLGLGAPFLAVSASAPLLQAWYARLGRADSADPYWLYAASNVGSLAALLAYPFLIEPALGLLLQAKVWAVAYGVLGLALVGCGALAARSATSPREPAEAEPSTEAGPTDQAPPAAAAPVGAPTRALRLRWLLRSFAPACLLYGVTTAITTDLAAAPLLWVLPLALYLLTFVLAFRTRRTLPRNLVGLVLTPVTLILVVSALLDLGRLPGSSWLWVVLHLLGTFWLSLFMHRDLVDERPAAEHLTAYYLWIAWGGLGAGVLCALLAPLLFEGVVEYPLALVLSGLLLFDDRDPSPSPGLAHWQRRAAFLSAGVLWALAMAFNAEALGAQLLGYAALLPVAVLLALALPWGKVRAFHLLAFALILGQCALARPGLVHRERSFFGVHSVLERAAKPKPAEGEGPPPAGERFRHYLSGSTVHGRQSLDRPREPLAYYALGSPPHDLFEQLRADASARPGARVAVIGLGIGSLAAYAREGEDWRFYEIDPAVERIARDPELFTFMGQAPVPMPVVLGDGRKALEREAAAGEPGYDLLALDAFSSDAIPTHLLTLEAFDTYLARLRPGGVLAVNITNRYLGLEPLVASLAREHGLSARARLRIVSSEVRNQTGVSSSHWVALARDAETLAPLDALEGWRPLVAAEVRPWTDDHADLLAVIKLEQGD